MEIRSFNIELALEPPDQAVRNLELVFGLTCMSVKSMRVVQYLSGCLEEKRKNKATVLWIATAPPGGHREEVLSWLLLYVQKCHKIQKHYIINQKYLDILYIKT